MFGRNGSRLLVVTLLAGLVACGGSDDDAADLTTTTATTATPATTAAAPAALELPDDVTVWVEFPRYLQLQRRLEVAIDNQGETPFTVTSLALQSALFDPVAADERPTEVEAGRRRDLQIGLGPAVCPAPDGPVQVEVEAEIDGVAQRGLVDVDPAPLDRISDEECGREFVLDHVGVGYSSSFTVSDGVVDASLELQRLAGDDPVVVTATRGSVLIELRPTADPPSDGLLGTMAAGEDSLSIPVRMRVIRCDPHAVIESKKTFQLATWVGVGERDAQHLVVPPEGELRAALEQLIQDCLLVENAATG